MKLLLLSLAFASGLFAQSNTLTWSWVQGSGSAATSFNVKRGTASGQEAAIASVPVASGQASYGYTDLSTATNTLIPGVSYYYVITAVGAGGESGPSNEIVLTIPKLAPPNPPTNLTGVTSP